MNVSEHEVWQRFIEFPQYEVSTHGRIRNITTGLILSPFDAGHGYLAVNLHHTDGRHALFVVHRLVALTFLPITGPVVRHLDGNPLNNHIENLRWGTVRENVYDTIEHGRHFNKSKTHCANGHEYSEENTRISGGERKCRTCGRDQKRRYRQAVKARNL